MPTSQYGQGMWRAQYLVSRSRAWAADACTPHPSYRHEQCQTHSPECQQHHRQRRNLHQQRRRTLWKLTKTSKAGTQTWRKNFFYSCHKKPKPISITCATKAHTHSLHQLTPTFRNSFPQSTSDLGWIAMDQFDVQEHPGPSLIITPHSFTHSKSPRNLATNIHSNHLRYIDITLVTKKPLSSYLGECAGENVRERVAQPDKGRRLQHQPTSLLLFTYSLRQIWNRTTA